MDIEIAEFNRRRRWIWGCTGGCLGFLIILGAVLAGCWMWFGAAVPMVAPETFVTPQASAFLFVRVNPDDPMMVEVPVQLTMLPAIRADLPTASGRPLPLDAAGVRVNVERIAPLQLIVISQPDPDPEAERLLAGGALSVTHWGRLWDRAVRAIIAQNAQKQGLPEPETYKGGMIAMGADDVALAVHTGSYMAAESKAICRYWLDRISAQRQSPEDVPAAPSLPEELNPLLRKAYERLDADAPVRMVSLNADAEIAHLLALVPSADLRQALQQTGVAGKDVLSFAGQLASINSRDARLTLHLTCADDAGAARLHDALGELVRGAPAGGYLKDVAVERREGRVVTVTGRIENLPDAVVAFVSRLLEARKAEAEDAPQAEPPTPPSP